MRRAGLSGLVLAGGRSRRMGGQDKGLVDLNGRPMAAWVVERLRPQVDEVVVCANRHLDGYAALGCKVISDATGAFAGPLAGMAAGLAQTRAELMAVVPCDTPLFPPDLVGRLLGALGPDHDAAVATTSARLQPVHCLLRRNLLPSLSGFLDAGGHQVARWYAGLRLATVEFSGEEAAFGGANTPAELATLASLLGSGGSPQRAPSGGERDSASWK